MNEQDCMELFTCVPPVKIQSKSESDRKSSDSEINSSQYIQYLEKCDPLTDINCPGWIIDGKPLKKNPACRMGARILQQETEPCRTFGVKVNPDLILPEEEFRKHIYGVNTLLDICDSRWSIPSDNTTTVSSSYTYTPPSPVASLYCSIVEFLGGRCE